MSGSTIGGFAGAIVGTFFGMPQLGFVIGSMIGGAVDPDKIHGPRIGDGMRQTSQVGIPITYGWGTFSTAGNMLWQSPVREVKKEDDGKGGPVSVTYHPYQSFALLICRAKLRDDGLFDPIAGILQVKQNGKVVYSVLPDTPMEILAGNAKFLEKHRFFLGGEDQMPSSVIESFEGAGNVPAHRGTVYMVADDLDLTDWQGAIPQYEFVVVMNGEILPPEPDTLSAGRLSPFVNNRLPLGGSESLYQFRGYYVDQSGAGSVSPIFGTIAECLDWVEALSPAGRPIHYLGYSDSTQGNVDTGSYKITISDFQEQRDVTFNESVVLVYQWQEPELYFDIDASDGCSFAQEGSWLASYNGIVLTKITGTDPVDMQQFDFCGGETWTYGYYPFCIQASAIRVGPEDGIPEGSYALSPGFYIEPDGTIGAEQTFEEVEGSFKILSSASTTVTIDDRELYTYFEHGPAYSIDDPDYPTQEQWEGFYDNAVNSGTLPPGWTYGAEYPVSVGTVWQGSIENVSLINRDKILLATVVGDLFKSDGLESGEFNVAQLDDEFDGFSVSAQTSVDSILTPLTQAFFFDVGEWDDQLHAIKRGGDTLLDIPYSALAARDNEALSETEIQEVELLRKVNVIYIDPKTGFTPAKQTWERRSNLIKAEGEQTLELAINMDHTTAARIAAKRGKSAWSEPRRQEFSLPYNHWPQLTATDPVNIQDKNGDWQRIRLMKTGEESGLLDLESSTDRQSAYTSNVEGVSYPDPSPPPSELAGPTVVIPLNVSPMRDQDDQLGIYLAVSGLLPSWPGGIVQISTDGGVTWTTVAEVIRGSTIGYTTTALVAEDPLYPSVQTLNVYLPDAPSSVDYATLLRYANRMAILRPDNSTEVIQFQTVTQIDGNQYRLSGLIRGRYQSGAQSIPSNASIALIDSSIIFVQAQRWMLGTTIKFRGVTVGASSDDAPVLEFEFDPAKSQTEWPVHYLQAERNGSDIAVSWIGRPRLGTSLTPYHSQYFAGYRVTFDDGTTIDTFDTTASTYTYSNPDPVTITVIPLNSITGLGPVSEEVTV